MHACMNLNAYVFLCLLTIHVYACYVVIYLLFMDYAWKKGKTLLCAKIGTVMPLLIFKIHCINSEEFSISMNYQVFISKVKPYLCYHQSPKKGRLKVHLDP
jgi:hypothetical protein